MPRVLPYTISYTTAVSFCQGFLACLFVTTQPTKHSLHHRDTAQSNRKGREGRKGVIKTAALWATGGASALTFVYQVIKVPGVGWDLLAYP